MNTGPNPIDFGVVPPQGGMTAYFMVYDAQSSALLEARITDDDSNGRFSLKMLRSYTKRPVSGGLPHTPWGGPGFNLIETDFTDGTRPLRVFTGQLVGIELRFDDAGTDAQGQFGATLVINDMSPTNRWPEITAKMIAIVASITTTLPAVVDLTQGQPATVPITIVSNVGPDTTVSYTLWGYPPGISMEPLLDVPLPRGGRVARNLSFQAAPDAPLGVLEVSIDSKAFNNKLDIQLKLPVVVIAPPATAIVLSGGGAKGSFEVGALLYLREIWNEVKPSIICGTSVGAINALALAAHSDSSGVDIVERIWLGLQYPQDMYVPSAPVKEASDILGFEVQDLIIAGGGISDLFSIYTRQIQVTGQTLEWAGIGLLLGGPFGALIGGAIQLFAEGPADKLTEAFQALKKASYLLDLSPTLAKIQASVSPNDVATSGMKLRLAVVALEDGQLYYVTEGSRLVAARNPDSGVPILNPNALFDGTMASAAMPLTFQARKITTDYSSMFYVDGGVREVVPGQAAVELGAQVIFLLSASPYDPGQVDLGSTPDGSRRATYGDDGMMFPIARRGVDLAVNQVAETDVAPRPPFADNRERWLIQPLIEVHDTTQIDPGLIRINIAYGYCRAFNVDQLRRNTVNAVQFVVWQAWADALILERLACHAIESGNKNEPVDTDTKRSAANKSFEQAREGGVFNHSDLEAVRMHKNEIATMIVQRFDGFGPNGFPPTLRDATMGNQSALDWADTWEVHPDPLRGFLNSVNLWEPQIIALGQVSDDGGRSSPPLNEAEITQQFFIPQYVRDGLRNR